MTKQFNDFQKRWEERFDSMKAAIASEIAGFKSSKAYRSSPHSSKLGMAGTEPDKIKTCLELEREIDDTARTILGWDISIPRPDLPLKARVAMLDGWENIRRSSIYDEIENPQWVGYRKQQGGTAFGVIPDYPNDLVAAMGALEEYCRKHNYRFDIYLRPMIKNDFTVNIVGGDDVATINERFLPQAICEAIVAHAEQAK